MKLQLLHNLGELGRPVQPTGIVFERGSVFIFVNGAAVALLRAFLTEQHNQDFTCLVCKFNLVKALKLPEYAWFAYFAYLHILFLRGFPLGTLAYPTIKMCTLGFPLG